MKQLLKDPLHADTDEFLKYHGLNGPKVLSLLLQRSNPEDKNSAIIYKTIQIKNNGVDDNGKRLKDSFTVNYTKKVGLFRQTTTNSLLFLLFYIYY